MQDLSTNGSRAVMVAITVLGSAALVATVLAYPQSSTTYSPPPTDDLSSPCEEAASRLYLEDGPQKNYLYSDCHTSAHVIVTTPRPDSNTSVVKPRLIVAWPAGNSGAMAYFAPESGQGSLNISLEESGNGETVQPLNASDRVGVSASINFNTTARLTQPILGSIRAIRDQTEGSGIRKRLPEQFRFRDQRRWERIHQPYLV